jgi:hypothetical protein
MTSTAKIFHLYIPKNDFNKSHFCNINYIFSKENCHVLSGNMIFCEKYSIRCSHSPVNIGMAERMKRGKEEQQKREMEVRKERGRENRGDKEWKRDRRGG